ncbi:uncharacterized protein LOC122376025 [Amphibalanus amphitrite]|uniref:uncharacterized protein LOC122376025 n=1 Tax=Amphibalanus amphitrite TaxID=1232801 RepID=UPI001C91ABFD|nr:uncharacterized protein LOC122376025 [Amphibalanus amphitrite]
MAATKNYSKYMAVLVVVAVVGMINYVDIFPATKSNFYVLVEQSAPTVAPSWERSEGYSRLTTPDDNTKQAWISQSPRNALRKLSTASETATKTTRKRDKTTRRPSTTTTVSNRKRTTPSHGAKLPNHPIPTGLVVNTSACQLHEYDPWDPTVTGIINNEKPFGGCRQNYAIELQQNGSNLSMHVNKGQLHQQCEVTCCTQAVRRDGEGKSDDKYKIEGKVACFGSTKPIVVQDELVRVQCFCKGSKSVIYEDFRAFILPKPPKEVSKSTASSTSSEDKLNVYMVAIDSVSRLNFKRQMPEVDKKLKSLGAIMMNGLTKVGRNTLPNMLPLLAGMTIDELKPFSGKPLDGLPLLWKNFSSLGYSTLYTEDESFMSTFNYNRKGFHITPTDYYMRPLYRAMGNSTSVKKSTITCVNQRAHFDLQIQWLEDFISLPEVTPQFSLVFSNSLSHRGPLTYVHPMEKRLGKFIHTFTKSSRFNSSILLVFSDHGVRIGSIMKTELGGYESRLPFFYILLPPWYEKRYPERVANLRINCHRLTTFFDVHATLRQLLVDAGGAVPPPMRHPGVSLFEPIAEERSCEAAEIAPHWCVCRARKPLSTNSSVVLRAAFITVYHINNVILGEAREKCVELSLSRVVSAQHTISEGAREQDNSQMRQSFEELVVQFVTEPGMGEFEATIRCWKGPPPTGAPKTKPKSRSEDQEDDWLAERCQFKHTMSVLDLSRLNLYKGQSECITEAGEKKLFCYCKNLL